MPSQEHLYPTASGDNVPAVCVAVPRRLGRAIVLTLLAVVLLALLGALFVIGAQHIERTPQVLRTWVPVAAGIKRWGGVIQTLLLLAIVLGWPRIVDWFLRKDWISATDVGRALNLRWRVLAFGAAYLLLVVIGPGTIWMAFAQ